LYTVERLQKYCLGSLPGLFDFTMKSKFEEPAHQSLFSFVVRMCPKFGRTTGAELVVSASQKIYS